MNASDWPVLDGLDRQATLWMFTIYDRPRDYPDAFVVRRSFSKADERGEPLQDVVPRLASTLEEARALVPPGLHRLPRDARDDAFIVEVWF